MTTQIINGRVLTPMGWVEGGSVLIEDTRIKSILNHSRRVEGVDKVIDAQGNYVLPGGIDIHVHGGGGRDFMECTEDAFVTAVGDHRRPGTKSPLPTPSPSTPPPASPSSPRWTHSPTPSTWRR